MVIILIIGLSMAILSAVFWIIESMPFVKEVRMIKVPDSSNPIALFFQCSVYVCAFVKRVPLLWRLFVDIAATILLTGAFGFSGMIGSIIGLSVSNVISVYLVCLGNKPIERSTV
jgi:hypothetical protein